MHTNFHIAPTPTLRGTIKCSSDKSISHRAAILGALADGTTTIHHFLQSTDCLATLAILRQLGVNIDIENDIVRIQGVGLHGLTVSEAVLDCHNSATALRLLTGILAAQPFASQLSGDASLCQRPMARIIEPLHNMGAVIHSDDNRAPLTILPVTNRLHAINYNAPIASAQVQTCLLFAGLYADGMTTVQLPAPVRNHSALLLTAFGANVSQHQLSVSITPTSALQAQTIRVVGDLSSSAFFIVAACIANDAAITITDVGMNPTRRKVIDVLHMMGANIRIDNMRYYADEPIADIQVTHSQLTGITIPTDWVSLLIDELPILLLAASCATGQTRLSGAAELRVKESDRLQAMALGLRTLGVSLQLIDDGIIIDGLGERPLTGGIVNSQGDHRIAMTLAMAALRTTSAITIVDCDTIATSFPQFVATANTLGLVIEAQQKSNICTEET